MARLRTGSLKHWLLPTALLAAAFALHSAPTAACSYELRLIEAAYPGPGAVDVPTNAVLFAYGHSLSSEAIQLFDANGTEVPVQIQPAEPSGFDVRPLSPLEPGRSYELRATGERGSSDGFLPFTTGTGPAAIPEHLEPPELDVAVIEYPPGPCGSLHGLCLDTAAPPGTTLEVRIGEEVLSQASAEHPSNWFAAYGTRLAEGDCLDVRARDVRGRRSAPRTVCGADAQRIVVPPDASVSYTCENYSALTQAGDTDLLDIDPGFSRNPDADVTSGTSATDSDLPEPQDVIVGANGSERAESGGCQLMSNAARSGASMLSIGLLALLSMRRRRSTSGGPT